MAWLMTKKMLQLPSASRFVLIEILLTEPNLPKRSFNSASVTPSNKPPIYNLCDIWKQHDTPNSRQHKQCICISTCDYSIYTGCRHDTYVIRDHSIIWNSSHICLYCPAEQVSNYKWFEFTKMTTKSISETMLVWVSTSVHHLLYTILTSIPLNLTIFWLQLQRDVPLESINSATINKICWQLITTVNKSTAKGTFSYVVYIVSGHVLFYHHHPAFKNSDMTFYHTDLAHIRRLSIRNRQPTRTTD